MNEFFAQLFPQAPSYLPTLLGDEQARLVQQQAQQQGLLGLGLGLLQASAPAPVRSSLGAGIAQGLATGQQMAQSVYQQRVQEAEMARKIEEMKRQQQMQALMQQIAPIAARGGDIGQELLAQLAGVMRPDEYGKFISALKTRQEMVEGPKPEFREVGGALYEIKQGQPPKLIITGQGKMTGDYANVAMGLFGTANVSELPEGAFGRIQQEIIKQKEAGRTVIDMTGGQKGFENERALRNDFQGLPEFKAFQEMRSAHSAVADSLKQGTPIGDVAAATKIMKLLDPGSVVRESELGIAMAATGLLDRVRSYANNIITGQRLTAAQKVQFEKLANELFGSAVTTFNEKRKQYADLATEYGFDPNRIVGRAATLPEISFVGAVGLNAAAKAELERRKGK